MVWVKALLLSFGLAIPCALLMLGGTIYTIDWCIEHDRDAGWASFVYFGSFAGFILLAVLIKGWVGL